MLACASGDGLDRYALHGAWRIRGLDDPCRVTAALDCLSSRHEVLRTRLRKQDGGVLQEILPSAAPSYSVVSLEHCEPSRRADALRRLMRTVVREPFDLRCAPWLRATLVRIGCGDDLLLISTSHAAADAYGWSILIREFTQAIDARRHSAAAAPEPLQFRDHVERERSALQIGNAGASARLEQRAPRDPFGAAELDEGVIRERAVELPGLTPATVRRLMSVAAGASATLPMAVLALFVAALVRAGARNDILVGTFDVNRRTEGSDSAMGCFVSLMLIHVQLRPDMPFRSVLEVVRDRFLEGLDENLPLEHQVASLPPRYSDPLTRRLCDVLFNYQAGFTPEAPTFGEANGLTIAPGPLVQAPVATARAPWAGASLGITIRMSDAGALYGWMSSDENADVYTRERVDSLVSQWGAYTRQTAAHPERSIAGE